MAIRVWADPDVGPGRRDREPADPLDDLPVANRASAGVEVCKTAPVAATAEAGLCTVDALEPQLPTRLLGDTGPDEAAGRDLRQQLVR